MPSNPDWYQHHQWADETGWGPGNSWNKSSEHLEKHLQYQWNLFHIINFKKTFDSVVQEAIALWFQNLAFKMTLFKLSKHFTQDLTECITSYEPVRSLLWTTMGVHEGYPHHLYCSTSPSKASCRKPILIITPSCPLVGGSYAICTLQMTLVWW